MATRSSHPALSNADGFASGSADLLLLIGRILLGQLFVLIGWGKLTNVAGATAYFNSLGVPAADFMPYLVGSFEVLLGCALFFGIATRYAAIATFLFVLATTVIAHRYWTYPAAQQVGQYNNFVKNIAIMGGALFLLVAGPGRYSVDANLAKK